MFKKNYEIEDLVDKRENIQLLSLMIGLIINIAVTMMSAEVSSNAANGSYIGRLTAMTAMVILAVTPMALSTSNNWKPLNRFTDGSFQSGLFLGLVIETILNPVIIFLFGMISHNSTNANINIAVGVLELIHICILLFNIATEGIFQNRRIQLKNLYRNELFCKTKTLKSKNIPKEEKQKD